MQTTEQQPLKITEEINRLRTLLSDQLTQARGRVAKAEAGLAAAQTELEAARSGAAEAELQFGSYNTAFPAPTPPASKQQQKVKPSSAKVPAAAVVVSRPVGRPPGRPPGTGRRSGPTVPDRLCRVMGDQIWTAGELEQALSRAGEVFQSANLRPYIATTFNSSTVSVLGPNDQQLRDRNGKVVKVHVFTCVERGRYRVSTEQDVQNEVQRILNEGEGGNATPADQVFEEQGIEIPAPASATH